MYVYGVGKLLLDPLYALTFDELWEVIWVFIILVDMTKKLPAIFGAIVYFEYMF